MAGVNLVLAVLFSLILTTLSVPASVVNPRTITAQNIKQTGRRRPASAKISKTANRKNRGIPVSVLLALEKAGAKLSKSSGENLYLVENIRFNDTAWKIFEAFAETAPDKPLVVIGFSPSQIMSETLNIPPMELRSDIVEEAMSIRTHYARLNLSAVAEGAVPDIPGPLQELPSLQEFPFGKLALSCLLKRIQNPNHPEYPTLSAIPSGSFVCSVGHHWRNVAIDISLLKP
jgi:hypothetical protein